MQMIGLARCGRGDFVWLSLAVFFLLTSYANARSTSRPNFVIIVVDDLRADDLGCYGHPFSNTDEIDRLAREGGRFLNAFATTPLCSPSRASLLTGLYAHRHGIVDNTDRSAESHRLRTFPRELREQGYRTAFVGKWHMGNDDSPRPGFDRWVCLEGQGKTLDAPLNIDGHRVATDGYVTDILSREALRFIDEVADQPFALYFAHKALHPETEQRADGSLSDPNASTFLPAERHAFHFADDPISRRPNAFVTPTDKPALMRQLGSLPPLGQATGTSDESIRGRLRMLKAVDESVGAIVDRLNDSNRLDDTVVIVTSDHGYFYGEHGLSVERRLAYEESIRIPLIVRYPPRVAPGSVWDPIVLTIDLAPTVLNFANVDLPSDFDGRSWRRVLENETDDWRTDFLIEHVGDAVFPRTVGLGYDAIRNQRWKLIRYRELQGMDELYDLTDDPYELRNLIDEPQSSNLRRELETRLQLLKRTTTLKP